MSAILKQKLIDIANGFTKYGLWKWGTEITVDSALSTTSTNPVQNKVVTTAINKKQDKLKTIDINIKLKNYSFIKNNTFYYSNVPISDLIGSYSLILSATITWWSYLTNTIVIHLDGDGDYLSLIIPAENINAWNDKSQINVRFVYI